MCSVICRVRMEFISCRVLRENIPHKPSPWWVGEGRGRLQTSWKTGDRTKTKGAPGSAPAPVTWEGTTSPVLCWCKGTWEGPSQPRLGKPGSSLSSPVLLSVSALGEAPGAVAGPAAQWVWRGPCAQGLAGRWAPGSRPAIRRGGQRRGSVL